MSQREIKSFDPRWAVIGLIGAVAIVAAFFAANALDQAVTPQVTGRVNSTSFATALSQGPVSGMPEGTFRALTEAPVVVPNLAKGPISGMPEGTFRALTQAPAAPELADGPISGMPEGTFRALTHTPVVPGPTDGPIPGMPNETYELVRSLSAR